MGNEMGNQIVTATREHEDEDATNMTTHSSNSPTTSNVIHGYLDHDKQAVFEQHGEENTTIDKLSTALNVSNDAEHQNDVSRKILSAESEMSYDNTGSAYVKPPLADDNLHQKTLEVEDEKKIPVLDTLTKNEEAYLIPSVEIKYDGEEKQTSVKCDELSGGIIGKMAHNLDASGSYEKDDKMEISATNQTLENNESSEESFLMGSDKAFDENEKEIGKKNSVACDMHDCVLQSNKSLSTESIDIVFLDAVDTEIKSLLTENDKKEIKELYKTEPHECHTILNVISDNCKVGILEDVKMDNIQISNFHTQAKANDPSQRKHETEKIGLYDLYFEEPIHTNQAKMTVTVEENQQENNSSSITKDCDKGTEQEEIVKGKELMETPVLDKKQEQHVEYVNEEQNKENKLVRDNEIIGKRPFEFPSLLLDPVATMSKDIVKETNEKFITRKSINETTSSNEGLSSETNPLEDHDNTIGERLHSKLTNPIDEVSGDMMKKEESNTGNGTTEENICHRIEEVFDATMYEKAYICEINLVEPKVQYSPLAESSNLKFNVIQPDHRLPECSEEFKQKEAAEESEMMNQKDLSSSSHFGECLDVNSVLPNIRETLPSLLSEQSNLKFNVIQPDHRLSEFFEEFEQKKAAEEYEILNQEDLSDCLDIYRDLSDIADKNYEKNFELDMKKSSKTELNVTVSKIKTQAVPKVEDDGKILDSVVKTEEEECSLAPGSDTDTDLKTFQTVSVSNMETQAMLGEKILDSDSKTAEPQCHLHGSVFYTDTNLESCQTNRKFTLEPNQDEINVSVTKMQVQAMLKVEDGEKIMASVIESKTVGKECSLHAPGSDTDTDVEEFQSKTALTLEPNQDKFDVWTANDVSEKLEKSSDGTFLLKQQDLKEASVFPSTEDVKDHMNASSGKAQEYDCDENAERCQHISDQETISIFGTETADAMLQSNNNVFDKSPQQSQGRLKDNYPSAPERSNSLKLQTPLHSLMKEAHVLEPLEKKEDLSLNKNKNEVWKSSAEEFIATPARGKGKQKHRSSFFSNFMCCTTGTN
ncbi:hypothetical protein MUK42_26152 [Musa troglodytarum]|uniref:Uncharacterized protein n=3 Tax=Musa troglodytarum TaxID=320322 RepID=A0A9E7HMS9_9LILI|nr:hypothetical protein MUK42_26152 [Musa troglodytarum]